ncbi:hypothetical protein HanIR_Chr01g0031811 [Helianthus annuus]|nr:hypothetical protein HanIR_Chr01g0031811 [Helianthus annuus]
MPPFIVDPITFSNKTYVIEDTNVTVGTVNHEIDTILNASPASIQNTLSLPFQRLNPAIRFSWRLL